MTTSRHYSSKPTHGIGRYKHLVKPEEVKGAVVFYLFIFKILLAEACGILVPQPGIGPMPPAVEVQS